MQLAELISLCRDYQKLGVSGQRALDGLLKGGDPTVVRDRDAERLERFLEHVDFAGVYVDIPDLKKEE